MAKKRSGIIGRIVAFLLVLLILGTALALVLHYTNGGNEDFKTFYLKHDGKDIMAQHSSMSFTAGEEERFDVKYTFDLGRSEARDYNVKIVPNEDEGFDFTVNGLNSYWTGKLETMSDLSELFHLQKEATYFTFCPDELLTIEKVLQKLYPNADIDVPDADELFEKPLYTLEVSSYNERVKYEIDFSVIPHPVGDVDLDGDHFLFGGGSALEYSLTHEVRSELDPLLEAYVDVTCPEKAISGVLVTFNCRIATDGTVSIDLYTGTQLVQHLGNKQGEYSFIMPQSDAVIVISIK